MKRLLRAIWYVLQLRCDEAERLMHRGDETSLTWSERSGLRAHRALCRSCRSTQRQVRRLTELLREVDHTEDASDPAASVVMDAAAKERLRERLRRPDATA